MKRIVDRCHKISRRSAITVRYWS